MGVNGSAADAIYASHLFGKGGRFANNQAVRREMQISRMYTRILSDLALNRFKWEGLPEGMDQRFIEICLFNQALAVVYKDKRWDNILAVKGSGIGYSTVFDNPVSFTVISPGELGSQFGQKFLPAYDPMRHKDKSETEKAKKAVPIWANYLRQPDVDIVDVYAPRLATIERTLEINSKNARRNKVLKGPATMQLSLVNVARMIDQGDEVIQVTGPIQDLDGIDTIDLGILPDQYEKLSLLRTRWWNECMGLLGIDAANQDKKERLVAAEVTANDAQADSIRFMNLQARQFACEQINDVFKLDISVDFNLEIEAKAQQAAAQLATQPEPINSKDDE